MRRVLSVCLMVLLASLFPGGALASASGGAGFSPGAPGVGDPYFPLDGNGGYDVESYLLDIEYDPATDHLEGTARIRARATQNLSSFNLDFDGMVVAGIRVDGRQATWSRDDGELTITPQRGIRRNARFTVVVRYGGVPDTLDIGFGPEGFVHTDDGTLVIGEPHVASTWYPVNDHPSDKAAYTFRVTVPEGLEAIANGVLVRNTTHDGKSTWVWRAREPMASYLTTVTIGEFDLRSYRADGIRYWDAIDPDLLTKPSPPTGEQFALSQAGEPAYKRLSRTIAVPGDGATLSFWVFRDTEAEWDFMFVEAHTDGEDDWTTLPDANGHTSQDTGFVCPYWLGLHPFLVAYQSDLGDETCAPSGSTGEWWAASGASTGGEQWLIDLSAYAGSDVEVSISYASDEFIQMRGVFVDDIEVSTGEGSTSFENDSDPWDGWEVTGAPPGSPPNPNDWITGTADDVPPGLAENLEASLARQPEITEFLSGVAGPYPFAASGAIVDDFDIYFALENQTRPIYSKFFFGDPLSGELVVVHELAHQWYGDSLAVERWQHIWLNEGFASYAEWLWLEDQGIVSAQQIFDDYATIPADDPFWALEIGDPGPDRLFDGAVYNRGAMTLHALRGAVGDRDFSRILRAWAATQAGGLVTTDEFHKLAERISGEDLDDLFAEWLFTAAKPAGLPEPTDPVAGVAASAFETMPTVAEHIREHRRR